MSDQQQQDQLSKDFEKKANISQQSQGYGQYNFQPTFQPGASNFQPSGQYYNPYGQYGGAPYGQYGGYGGAPYGQQYGGYGGGYNQYQQPPQEEEKTLTLEEYQKQKKSFTPAPKAAGKSLNIGGGGIKIGDSKPKTEIKIGDSKPKTEIKIGDSKPKNEIKIGDSKPKNEIKIGDSKPKTNEVKIDGGDKKPQQAAASPSPAPASAANDADSTPKAATPESKSASATPAPTASSKSATPSETPSRADTPKQSAEALAKEQEQLDKEIVQDMFGGGDVKEHMSIIFMGHVDAGKSTMGGNILYLTGAVDKRTVEKYERDAKDAGRQGWYLSWVMDTNREERDQGKTVEVGRAYFETDKRRYTILDAPGHKMYVPSMIGGASQADIGILVISARKGEYETGFERGGQTREHAILAKTQGVNKLIVVINKMDDPTVGWSKERYDECTTKLGQFLKATGFSKEDVYYMPVSGYTGAGLKERVPAKECPWYDGPALLEYLDNCKAADRRIGAPFMLPVSNKGKDLGTIVEGKIESGAVKKGDQLVLMPNRANVEVSTVFNESESEVSGALCGEQVRLRLKGVEEEDVQIGFVLTSSKNPVQTVTKFEAQIAIVELKTIVTAGFSCVMHVHTAIEEVTLTQLLHKLEKGTNRKSKKPPAFAKKGMKIIATLEAASPVCVETFEHYPQLGRFTLRDQGQTIAIGKITKILG